jgi:hypothetical protein
VDAWCLGVPHRQGPALGQGGGLTWGWAASIGMGGGVDAELATGCRISESGVRSALF